MYKESIQNFQPTWNRINHFDDSLAIQLIKSAPQYADQEELKSADVAFHIVLGAKHTRPTDPIEYTVVYQNGSVQVHQGKVEHENTCLLQCIDYINPDGDIIYSAEYIFWSIFNGHMDPIGYAYNELIEVSNLKTLLTSMKLVGLFNLEGQD